MKALIVSFWSNLDFVSTKYKIFDEKGEKTSVEYEALNESLAEAEYLKEAKIDTKISVFLPSLLSYAISDPPPDYEQLTQQISNEAKNKIPADYVHVLPSEGEIKNHVHKGGIGNFHFLFYLKLYEDLLKEQPDLVILDLSRTYSYFQAYAKSATQLAIEDYVSTTGGKEVFLIEFVNINNELTPIFTKDFKKIKIQEYLTANVRLSKEKGFSTQGRSDLYAIGKSVELGFPLLLVYLLRESDKLIRPEEFEKTIISSIKVNKSNEKYEVVASFDAHENAPYYFMGYHFVNQYKSVVGGEGEVTIDTLQKISELFEEPQRNLVDREIDLLRDFSKIPKEKGEYLLDYLIKLGNTRLIDWMKGEIPEEEREECEINEDEMYSHAGLGRKLTKIKIDEKGITVEYAESCIDKIISWIKNLGKG